MSRRMLDRLLLQVSNAADRGDLSGALALIGVLLEPGCGSGTERLCLLSRLLAVELGREDGTISREQYQLATARLAGLYVGVLESV